MGIFNEELNDLNYDTNQIIGRIPVEFNKLLGLDNYDIYIVSSNEGLKLILGLNKYRLVDKSINLIDSNNEEIIKSQDQAFEHFTQTSLYKRCLEGIVKADAEAPDMEEAEELQNV